MKLASLNTKAVARCHGTNVYFFGIRHQADNLSFACRDASDYRHARFANEFAAPKHPASVDFGRRIAATSRKISEGEQFFVTLIKEKRNGNCEKSSGEESVG